MDGAREVPDPPHPAVRRWLRRRGAHIRRHVYTGRLHVQRARRAIAGRVRVETGERRFDGRLRTPPEIRDLAAALALAAGPRPRARPVRFVGRGLTVVNLAMFVVLYGHLLDLDGSRPHLGEILLALALGTCTTTAQVLLALDVGRRLRPGAELWPAPEPPVPAVVGAGLLLTTSGLAVAASYGWAQQLASGPVAAGAGLLLAASTLAAPLMIVADEVYGAGPDGRLLRRAERVLGRVDRRCARRQCRADRRLDAADRALWRAERTLATVLEDLEPGHRSACLLAELVACLRREVAAARSAPADIDPLGPDDVDLAG